MLEVGKLYTCEEHCLMIYPDQETATAVLVEHVAARGAGVAVAYWSKQFGKPVSYAEKNIPLLPLNNKEEYVEVLAGDKKGWIIFKDWLNIKEIDNGSS